MAMPSRDRAWRLSAAALILAAALPAFAADKPCTKDDAALAEKAADSVLSWAALQRVVRDYRQCDQGELAKLLTDALMRVVIDGWPKLAEGAAAFDKDSEFREWVGRRLGSPAVNPDDAQAIRDLARANCPKGRTATCDFLLDSVNAGKPMEMPKLVEPPAPKPVPAPK
jgi:hypothetical protein